MRNWILFAIVIVSTATLAFLLRPGASRGVVTKVEVLPVSGTRPDYELPERLRLEAERLARLQKTLQKVDQVLSNPPESGSIVREIENLQTEQNSLQQRLATLQGEDAAVEQNALAYSQGRRQQARADQLSLAQQIQDADAQIVALESQMQSVQGQTAVADQAAALRPLQDQVSGLQALKDQLQSQINSTRLASRDVSADAAAEARAEQGEVRDERAEVGRELLDVKKELDYWRTQESVAGGDTQAQTQRVQDLQNQISLQQGTVAKLQAQVLRQQAN